VNDEQNPLPYLNEPERIALGGLVRRLYSTANPRFQKALESTGPRATARMACVNALRLYAVALFVLGSVARLARVSPAADLLYGLAGASMAWSLWCLYTVVDSEREYKRHRAPGADPA
jgi:hypothetical protein